jgi:transcriptional regulator with XRE-family HTH domain
MHARDATIRKGEAVDAQQRDTLTSAEPRPMTLAELRLRAKLSQRELGRRLDRQQTAVAQIERRENPTVNALRQFVGSLGGELELTVKVPGEAPVQLRIPPRRQD